MSQAAFSLFHEIIEKFQHALTALNYHPSANQLENLAILVHHGMSGPARNYHSHEHILELSANTDPLETLAILYHDIVYYQVDSGVASLIQPLVSDYCFEDRGSSYLRETDLNQKPLIELVYSIFGFESGQELCPSAGQNEFLSALVAVQALGSILKLTELACVVACIEGTIPFRSDNAEGKSCFDLLAERLKIASDQSQLGLDAGSIDNAVHRAVRVANKDVESFSYEDIGAFLDKTWKIIPENNPSLQLPMLYTIKDYQIALQKTETFLSSLNPEVVFHSYKGIPESSRLEFLRARTERSVNISTTYLRIKLYSISLLEAIAEETGGDIPLVFFMGDIPDQDSNFVRMEVFLPKVGGVAKDLNPDIVKLLEKGRGSETEFDMRTSPFSAFLYRHLGKANIMKGVAQAKKMFTGNMSFKAFLQHQDPWIVSEVAKACANLAITRKQALLALCRA